MKYTLTLIVVLLSALQCFAQDNSFPSKEEISQLVQKANQRVTDFERVVQAAKPFLSEDRFKSDTDAVTAAHRIIGGLNKNGLSAYALVALTIKLDDLVVSGDRSVQDILRDGWKGTISGKAANVSGLDSAVRLNVAGAAVNDITDLIGHATLRLINVEETALEKLNK
jgi:hypothetical protein